MAKKMEENVEIILDDDNTLPMKEVEKVIEEEVNYIPHTKKEIKEPEGDLVNCLRNTRVIVRYVSKQSGIITNPKHVLYGGMAENATRTFVVPKLSSGMFVNVLTDSEKAYLENIMGLDPNALSIYKKRDNFWDDSNEEGISRVRLTKQDTYLNLSDPEDYIRYKILLANKDYIAPSLQALQDTPKATYQFVLIEEGEENKMNANKMSITMQCYKEFGKIEEDKETLKFIVEIVDGRPLAKTVKLDFLHSKINDLIQSNNKLMLKTMTDPLLSSKVLLKKAIENGIVSKRGNFLYLRKDNTPLCESGEEPTLNIAARYINSPKHQEILFYLQAQTKE